MGKEVIDRLTVTRRPQGMPVMYQSWRKLLFMHWPLPPQALRPFIPPPLEIDTFDGQAFIAIAPFTVRQARPVFLPPIPWLSDFDEVNVRSYVQYQGVPGVWFFSLDASSSLAVLGARLSYHLPYFSAATRVREEGDRISYRLRRLGAGQARAELEAVWRKGPLLGEAKEGSLEFFLAERYCLYAADRGRLYRARIHHHPWQLQGAGLDSLHSTMIEAQGLPRVAGSPLLHYCERQDTAIWPLHRAG
ncbi:MAG TPA: DUF2071 domain-containing protein [Geomonas sp.]|nr:DUF2071 domain-containing protein [Geomonas sp.]